MNNKGVDMNNHIVTERCKVIRGIAKQSLKENWFKMALLAALFLILSMGVGNVLDYFFNYDSSFNLNGEIIEANVSFGSGIYAFILDGPLQLGLAFACLTFLRTRKPDGSLLFEGFEHFGKAFWLNLLMMIKVFLWTLLFIIPGIIAVFRYSQAYYVMVDHPELTANQCLKESSRIMMGNKWKFFGLNLSFIGWWFLASLPESFFEAFIRAGILTMPDNDIITFIVKWALFIPICFVFIYVEIASSAFYDLAIEKLVPINNQQD